jgi:hypothetical protein
MHVKTDDGAKIEFDPGDVGVIAPGHDAWVVGNEPVIDITGWSTAPSSLENTAVTRKGSRSVGRRIVVRAGGLRGGRIYRSFISSRVK